jgi:phosphocarrier protein FPr
MTSLSNDLVLLAPLTGPMVPLAAVPDPVFSSAMLGDGIGIDPLLGQLVAPCDGTISHLARTAHALTLTSRHGAQILLHIGIDTVELKGQGFTAKVQLGDPVKTGDVLIEFDLDYVATHARSLVSVIALVNGDAFTIVERAGSGTLKAGVSPLLTLRATGAAAAPVATAAAAASAASYSATVVLSHPGGLHARPAARAREAIRGLSAHVEVRYEGRCASIDSVVSLLGLGAGQGAAVEVVAQGDAAQAALDAVVMELQRAAPAEIEAGAPDRAARPAIAPSAGPAPMMQAHTLYGVCAGPGIGVGRLVHWGRDELLAPEPANGTPAQENDALERALARVDADLQRTVDAATQRGASGEAGIFTVHRLMLEDPLLLDAARDLIRRGKSAGYAWRQSIRAQVAVLAGVGDALLAERTGDLRDLEKRVLRALGHAGSGVQRQALPDEAVLAADEFTPADFSELDQTRVTALVMARGGATSHAAIIARQWGIAALVAVGDAVLSLAEGSQVIVDASQGTLAYAPDATALDAARAQRRRLDELRAFNRQSSQLTAATRDGHTIEVAANIATLADAGTAVENGADAVGLLRTELLFIHRRVAPSVAEHTQSYQGIVDALAGRTAIIRTLDVGGDKEVEYLTLPPEPNPALGLRGIRLAQVHPELLDDQLRGMLAVQPYGRVRILLPMVTDVGELIRLRARIDALTRDAGRGAAIEVGVMIEVPSAALLADQLAQHADFLSIGTNDLTQYTLAIDRCQPELAARADGLHPAVLRLIAMTAAGAAQHGKWLGVCGALAGDPLAVPLLIGLGVTELSVDPVSVPGIKARIRTLDYQLCRQRAQDILALESPQAVRAASRETWPLDG